MKIKIKKFLITEKTEKRLIEIFKTGARNVTYSTKNGRTFKRTDVTETGYDWIEIVKEVKK